MRENIYEAHITSLAVSNENDRQRKLFDDMFAKGNTCYLHLMRTLVVHVTNNTDAAAPVQLTIAGTTANPPIRFNSRQNRA